jgi:K+-transporting ATPase KdpF subunit
MITGRRLLHASADGRSRSRTFQNLEQRHDGCRRIDDRRRLLRGNDRVRLRLRPAVRASVMIFDYSLAGLVTAGLLIYLTYALLKPERF